MRRQTIGQILFAVGLLLAVIGAAKAPSEGVQWPDTWPLFVGGWVLGCIGVVIWRISTSSQKEDFESGADVLAILQTLNQKLQEESVQWYALESCTELNQKIESFQKEYVVPFSLNRNQFITRLGMEAGAEIIITCSYGERMLNRVWSASADAHLPEALSSLKEATQAFSLAVQQLQSLHTDSLSTI